MGTTGLRYSVPDAAGMRARDDAILEWVRGHVARSGTMPGYRDVGAEFGLAVGTVHAVMGRLAARGLVVLPGGRGSHPGVAGGAELPDPPPGLVRALTPRQRAVLAVFVAAVRREGRCPSLREICRECGFASANGALCHVLALARKGLLRDVATPGRQRKFAPAWIGAAGAVEGGRNSGG